MQTISSFGFNGDEGNESLTHASIGNVQLISESIPMTHEHFSMVQSAIVKAHNLGVEKAFNDLDTTLKALNFNKPLI